MEVQLDSTCRICLKDGAKSNIFSCKKTGSKRIPCCKMMSSLFSFSISQSDGMPYKICQICKNKLSSAYKLRCLAENSDKALKEYFSQDNDNEVFDGKNFIKLFKSELLDMPENSLDSAILVTDKIKNMENMRTENVETANNNESVQSDREESSVDIDFSNINDTDFDEDDSKPLTFIKSLNFDEFEKQFLIKEDTDKRILKKHKKAKMKSKFKSSSGVVLSNLSHKRFSCDKCSKVFTDQSSRRRHNKVQHLGLLYYCEICNKTYRSKNSHLSSHRIKDEKKFNCNKCGEMFSSLKSFNFHKKSHNEVMSFPCETCGKTFATKGQCTAHRLRVHEKIRPHKCQYCAKGFFSKHSLQEHITTHTKERKYDCKECGMIFTTLTVLREHELRHTGVKKFSCSICEKKFYRSKELKRHLLIHSDINEHECNTCGLKFRRKDHVLSHERNVHKIPKTVIVLD